MRKKLLLLSALAIALVIAACGKGSADDGPRKGRRMRTALSPTGQKYTVKSGIVEYENVAMGITMKKTLYFDDYGKKECEESFFEGNLNEVNYTDGTDRFTMRMNDKNKICWVSKGNGRYGLAAKVDVAGVKNYKGRMEISVLPNRTIAGFDCEGYVSKRRKMETSMFGYKNVLMSMENTGRMKVKSTAVKASFDVEIPADKFQPRAGFTLKEIGQK